MSIALGVTCSHVAGGLPYLEWRRALDLLERLDLPVSDPRVATPPGAIGCGLLPRIGAGISAERLEAASMAAAADMLRERAQRTRSRRSA